MGVRSGRLHSNSRNWMKRWLMKTISRIYWRHLQSIQSSTVEFPCVAPHFIVCNEVISGYVLFRSNKNVWRTLAPIDPPSNCACCPVHWIRVGFSSLSWAISRWWHRRHISTRIHCDWNKRAAFHCTRVHSMLMRLRQSHFIWIILRYMYNHSCLIKLCKTWHSTYILYMKLGHEFVCSSQMSPSNRHGAVLNAEFTL